MQEMAKVCNVEIIFEGRADLVMAYADKDGKGYLQVIDMKTTGCLYGFNHANPKQGTPLQNFSGDIFDRHPSNPAEQKIIDKYNIKTEKI